MEFSAWDAGAIVLKALVYAATLSAAGGVFFVIYNGALISIDQRVRLRRWVTQCVVVAFALSIFRIVILAGSMGEGFTGMRDSSLIGMVLQAGEGRALGIRIVGLLLVATDALMDGIATTLALLGAVLAATSFAWTGHEWAAHDGGLSVALLSLHLIGAAFWLGALLPLLRIVRDGDLPRAADTAARFGNAAVIVVFGLIAAGLTLAFRSLTGVSDLWTTTYGRALSTKLVFVACLLIVAALNKLILTPKLMVGDRIVLLRLDRAIRIEVFLGGLILVVTATLTTLAGPPA